MTQVTEGLQGLLSSARGYSLFQTLIGADRVRRILAADYIQVQQQERILDLGCGTAEILEYLHPADYHGFDLNPAYIESARGRFGGHGRFTCADVNAISEQKGDGFDIVLAIGLLHHLEDDEADRVFHLASTCLKPGGRLVTLDCAYREGQSRAARFLIRRDRGQNVRTLDEYVKHASRWLPGVEGFLREDLLRVPYTHVILRCHSSLKPPVP